MGNVANRTFKRNIYSFYLIGSSLLPYWATWWKSYCHNLSYLPPEPKYKPLIGHAADPSIMVGVLRIVKEPWFGPDVSAQSAGQSMIGVD